jgi:hypothetical protein
MKTRTLFAAILVLLLTCDLSLSQESASLESTPKETSLAASSSREVPQEEPSSQVLYAAAEPPAARRSSSSEMVTKIFMLKHSPAENLAEIIRNIFNLDAVYSDGRSNQLILTATPEQMDDVQALIEKLDVEDSQSAAGPAVENLVYRVYMFEIPSKDKDLKPFSMILRTFAQMRSTALLDVAAAQKIQVSDFVIGDEQGGGQDGEREVDILIQGKAPSNESIKQMMENITKSQIRELKWDDDETFTRSIEAAHPSRLPAQIQRHIRNFLGEEIETVGYWFGSSSVPGQIEAPIGPWMLHLEISPESDRTLELRVEVRVPEEMSRFDRQLGRERSDEILSNTIQARVGKPIIVGYNRPSYGTRKMGAVVILPEADTIQIEETGSPSAPGSNK